MKRVPMRPFSFFGITRRLLFFGNTRESLFLGSTRVVLFGRRRGRSVRGGGEDLCQLIEEGDLGGIDHGAGGVEGVPGAFVDFGEGGLAAGTAGQFYREGIAHEFIGVQVAGYCPGIDPFAAFLANGLEFPEFTIEEDARFFVKFADSGVEGRFVGFELTFWNGPGTFVLVFPEWTAGVDEKTFE